MVLIRYNWFSNRITELNGCSKTPGWTKASLADNKKCHIMLITRDPLLKSPAIQFYKICESLIYKKKHLNKLRLMFYYMSLDNLTNITSVSHIPRVTSTIKPIYQVCTGTISARVLQTIVNICKQQKTWFKLWIKTK